MFNNNFTITIKIWKKKGQSARPKFKMPEDQSLLFTNECTSDCLKNNIKIYIKIAPTCFSAVTPSPGSSYVLAKVTVLM
jgi:hypothetical protein